MLPGSDKQLFTGVASKPDFALPPTPDDNLTLTNDIGSPVGKGQQFIILVTKVGNYFYLIIDRNENGKENVYLLNMVDEVDLLVLMDEDEATAYRVKQEEEKAGAAAPAVSTSPDSENAEQENASEPKPVEKSSWVYSAHCRGNHHSVVLRQYIFSSTEKGKDGRRVQAEPRC